MVLKETATATKNPQNQIKPLLQSQHLKQKLTGKQFKWNAGEKEKYAR